MRGDAVAIWKAGVDAVDSSRLMQNAVRSSADTLEICGHKVAFGETGQIAVVGAGKAGAGMAAALEDVLRDSPFATRLSGWVNVPEDCVRSLRHIQLHPARPAGLNEPTEAGVEGSRRILEIVSQLEPDDLCLVLLSGGGSALLPAPVPEISLAEKQAITRKLMRSGATINELNTVRKQLSSIKGGRLAEACGANTLISLVISDVIGDPLDVIASGPTVADTSTPEDALDVLSRFEKGEIPDAVLGYLKSQSGRDLSRRAKPPVVEHHVIGNNAVAVAAAAQQAKNLGYAVHHLGSELQGETRAVGVEFAEMCLSIRDRSQPIACPACVIGGGETVVNVAKTDQPRRGGRNQEFVLAALSRLQGDGMNGVTILSGGTDGEDGPTDVAGAVADQSLLRRVREQNLDPRPYLAINDSYTFFEKVDGLIKTGPTHTNVMDLVVGLITDPR